MIFASVTPFSTPSVTTTSSSCSMRAIALSRSCISLISMIFSERTSWVSSSSLFCILALSNRRREEDAAVSGFFAVNPAFLYASDAFGFFAYSKQNFSHLGFLSTFFTAFLKMLFRHALNSTRFYKPACQ